MTQEQENFYRHSTVIVDETKDSFLHLLDFYLTNHPITLQRFIEIHGHEIYHLCYNRYPCCQCPPGTRPHTKGFRVLHPQQLTIFLDPAGVKLLVHNPGSQSAPHCCCPANPKLLLQDLDLTLARLLLVNFTTLVPQGSLERSALDFLVSARNNSFAHAKEGKISNSVYQKSMADIENSLLVLAKIYGRETETKQRLRDIARQPLSATICLQLQNTLLQQCQIYEKIKRLLAEKALPEYLTKDLDDIRVLEGCDARLELWTRDEEVNVEWFKDDIRIDLSDKFVFETSDRMQSLIVTNTDLTDRGIYTVKILDSERTAKIDVEEYFTKNITKTIQCIEGDNVEMSCAVCESNIPAQWTKDGIIIHSSAKYKIKDTGKSHILDVIQLDLRDAGDYAVKINNRTRSSSVQVKEYFTKNLQSVECIEGEKAEFTCEVIEDSLTGCWSKHGVNLKHEGKYEIHHEGRIHRFSVTFCDLNDAGEYTVNINNRVRTTSLSVKEYFSKNLEKNVDCIEGDKVDISCVVLDADAKAEWAKDGDVLQNCAKYKMKILGRSHTLSIEQAKLQDAGVYTVKINNRQRSTSVQVKAIPAAIHQLSDKEKSLYLKIIQSATETRHYIKVMIIGENGVGKTCLLRRLMGDSIEDVESTDGIDIVHRCKIRLNDGRWFVEKGTDLKRNMMTRIKMAVLNAKTRETLPVHENRQDALQVGHFNLPGNENTHTALPVTHQDLPVNENTHMFSPVKAITHKILSVKAKTHEVTNTDRKDEQSHLGTKKRDRQTKEKRYSRDDTMNVIEPSSLGKQRPGNTNARLLKETKLLQVSDKKVQPSLDQVLNETILNELTILINDIDKYDISNEVFVDVGFWDFAGQKHYYLTHPIFLNPNAVHLLVADIMKDIKQINIEGGYDKIGEYIDFWFDSIHSCEAVKATKNSTEDYLSPPVILVCTGIDKCKAKVNERKNEFREKLLSLLCNEDKLKHLRRICSISNIEPSDIDLNKLRESIFEFGKSIKSFGERLPLRWIRLEQMLDIVREADVNILSWPDMLNLASKCSIKDTNEVSLFLKYHHKIGSIIYFESLKDHIILNQKWLADAFKCFVSDKYDSDLKLTKEWKTLEDTGELKPSLIGNLLSKEREREFYKHESLLLKIMEMFGIILKHPTYIEDEQKQMVPTYYMPCMISKKTSIKQVYEVFGVKTDTCTQTPWLCIQFDFMPFDCFNHIFCHYFRKYSVCTEALSGQRALYHGMGVFFLDNTKSRKLILCFSKNTIAMQIWQWKTLEPGKCKSILEELRSVILNLKDKYEPRRISYSEKIKCANGNIHFSVGRYCYKELTDLGAEEFFCEEHNEMHNIREFLHTWFEDYSVNECYKPSMTRFKEIQNPTVKRNCHVFENESLVYWCEYCQRSMLCNDLHQESNITDHRTLQHLHDMYSLNYNFQVNVRVVDDIKMLNDEVLVIADWHGQQLVTYHISGQQQNTIPLPVEPWNIAVLENNTVAVTSWYKSKKNFMKPICIMIVDVRQGRVIQCFDETIGCYSIMNRENQLFVGCIDETIKVMDMSGKVTNTIPVGVVPEYICGGKAGRIYYVASNKLNCIDTEGKHLFTFTDPDMRLPKGITSDDEGYVLIIYNKSNNVLRMCPDGKHSEIIITEIPPLSNEWAYLCYNSLSKSLIIALDDNVYVYQKV